MSKLKLILNYNTETKELSKEDTGLSTIEFLGILEMAKTHTNLLFIKENTASVLNEFIEVIQKGMRNKLQNINTITDMVKLLKEEAGDE